MFYLLELTHTIKLHPSFFGPNIRNFIRSKLLADVEGTCDGQYGYIICVLNSDSLDIPPGKIIQGQGVAEFRVAYQAIVWKPFKGEVVDAIVSVVNKMGFFADAGPLSVFVSTHLLPSELKFEPTANPPNYSGDDMQVERGSKVRLKLVGTRVDATEIFAIGTMKEDYLGAL
ncbi:DNA-directed RNA polymerase II subunit RPB7 [Protomyces lactucae-debilis]|uniref:DNA-directed RNA polymerase subunit n=1 Tax=Protomyces lactucae-debilis TaxID=2754530 RepID=A0A1Y2FD96_PROLT|nr:DNA-directed RNA polymerase II subunit RPB7 [Protomyces lactucae-debilis]ORY81902.1 DNA-directed RNA polymerase II subunit RPB7 [Protomyces lactucae-debilis]